jgi:glc operon protein GlcG
MKTRHIALFLFSSAILWASTSVTSFAQAMPPYGAPITIEQAKKAAGAAIARMRKLNMDMTIAIVDSGSNLIYLERSNQAGIGTIDAAIGKAKAANGIKTPTKVIGEMILSRNQSNLLGVPGAFPVEGGTPIVVDNKVIGAIGVSGGMPADDGAIATAGAAAVQP